MPALTSGTRVGDYEIAQRLPDSALGERYDARRVPIGRRVTLSWVEVSTVPPAARARLSADLATASQIEHPHIATALDAGVLDRHAYVVTPVVEGETLLARLGRAPLPPEEAVELFVAIVSALAFLHRNGLTHGHLTPECIYLERLHDGGVRPLLMDLGFESLPSAGSARGGVEADLRALGSILTLLWPGDEGSADATEGTPTRGDDRATRLSQGLRVLATALRGERRDATVATAPAIWSALALLLSVSQRERWAPLFDGRFGGIAPPPRGAATVVADAARAPAIDVSTERPMAGTAVLAHGASGTLEAAPHPLAVAHVAKTLPVDGLPPAAGSDGAQPGRRRLRAVAFIALGLLCAALVIAEVALRVDTSDSPAAEVPPPRPSPVIVPPSRPPPIPIRAATRQHHDAGVRPSPPAQTHAAIGARTDAGASGSNAVDRPPSGAHRTAPARHRRARDVRLEGAPIVWP